MNKSGRRARKKRRKTHESHVSKGILFLCWYIL